MSVKVFLAICCSFFCSVAVSVRADLPEYCGPQNYAYTPLRKDPRGEFTLKQVHVVIRHGDRTRAGASPCWDNDTAEWDCLLSSASIPTIKHDTHDIEVARVYRDAYMAGRNIIHGDCGLGHLTFKGYKQEEMNGENLRKAYVDTGFLSSNYSVHEDFFRTDDMSRTRQSAQALGIGLFPPPSSSSGKAQVVDIHVMDKLYDDIEPNANLCPKLEQYEKEFFASDMWKKHYAETTAPLLAEVQKALGLKYTLTIDGLLHVNDCLMTHLCHGFAIPSSVTQDLLDRIATELTYTSYSTFSYPSIQDYSRVGIGFLIAEMWQAMQDVIAGERFEKFYLYSGHDHTVMPFLHAFNASDYKWSPYASMVQLELLQVTNATNVDYAVRLLYHGQERRIPYCSASPCSLAEFSTYVKTIIPQDPVADCQVTKPEIMIGPRPPRLGRNQVLF
ncbi:unnamed protein product [Porites lobata]|uniref:Acid phosphatase n=1 Tax=Porites lobata TaxID=104759 RepID=A0ABN8P1D5_9CNID|nr:unnamed protein product [Porites lobata]